MHDTSYLNWDVAQGLEHLPDEQGVVGSIPTVPTKQRCSSVGLEHLPYKEGVIGSNPIISTM